MYEDVQIVDLLKRYGSECSRTENKLRDYSKVCKCPTDRFDTLTFLKSLPGSKAQAWQVWSKYVYPFLRNKRTQKHVLKTVLFRFMKHQQPRLYSQA